MKPNILIVEDDAVARTLAERILKPHYDVDLAADAHEARGKLIGGMIDLLLCDNYMPGESGLDLVETVLAREQQIAVVMVTGADDPALVERAFEMGVYGYLIKPYRSGDLLITVSNALRRRQLEIQARAHERQLEQDMITKSLETERFRLLLRNSEESLEKSRLETVHKLSFAVEMRDQVTGHHLSRMGAYCEEIAGRLELPDQVSGSIALAAQMHDIGKIAVPDHILLKAGPLTSEERELMQTHAEIGRRILQGSESPLLRLAESIAWTHHERFDGSGYPRGLSGEEIPEAGRIAAVADVFDALTRDRPYRGAMPMGEAAAIMAEGRGSHFDPWVLDSFMSEIPVAAAA
ncbi:MAG TPA: HD domain-containing phosphohydrolase [Solirubrobacterales bacterium]|jgi:putative two-component system response regulator|nr:HD domain-containing phosphohydrolase [Solirubrobacterales bacterium]